jgi:hypothetical protein
MVITASYGHAMLEQYFKHKGPVIDIEPNNVKTACALLTVKVGR